MAISTNFSPSHPVSTTTHTDMASCPSHSNSPSPRDSSSSSSHTLSHTADFEGNLSTNNEIPSQSTLKSVENLPILDQDGRSIPFKNLYTGPNVARRVLVIFIRHFYCGNCQEYIRTLTSSITPNSLLSLPTPTFIAIVGCGSSSLISMYQRETACPFPIYADPTKKLYSALGMIRTLDMGARPEYQRKESLSIMVASFVQSMRMMKKGQTLKGGDMYQVGGEFLFEPTDMSSPIDTPEDHSDPFDARSELGEEKKGEQGMLEHGYTEEKRITWCHRMRNTRDHAEIPELREVLGLDGEGVRGNNAKRWTKALLERKGTGLSVRSSHGPNASFARKVMELESEEDRASSRRGSSERESDKENLVR